MPERKQTIKGFFDLTMAARKTFFARTFNWRLALIIRRLIRLSCFKYSRNCQTMNIVHGFQADPFAFHGIGGFGFCIGGGQRVFTAPARRAAFSVLRGRLQAAPGAFVRCGWRLGFLCR